jgi:hypothetical protein
VRAFDLRVTPGDHDRSRPAQLHLVREETSS